MIRPSHPIPKQKIYQTFGLSYVLICLNLHIQPARAQDILEDANSVIVETHTKVLCKSMAQSIEKESLIVSILNRRGLETARLFCRCGIFRFLWRFSGEILSATGQNARKAKKFELRKSRYSSSFTTDDYFYYYEYNHPSFFFTVKCEWKMRRNNGLVGYLPFAPQVEFNQGAEKTAYRIELPAG